jgi:DNA-binding LacI/PurR family transcriptional regulator
MTMRVKDIAKELGVSVVTISKVLRDHPDISDETRERVLKYVKKVDYQPNILARGQAEESSKFAWFERAYEKQSNILIYIKVSPWFDPLRGDPRFQDLVRRIGLN